MISSGIVFALLSLVCWGFGDFLIQRSARHIGVWRTLFFVGLAGFIILLPFVKNDLFTFLFSFHSLIILLLTVVVSFFTSLFDFEALKEGKIAIVEPIIGLELPIAVALSVAVWGESLGLVSYLLVGVIFAGVMLSVTSHHEHLHYHKRIFERGVAFAGLGAVGMALTDFLVGVSSQLTSPLVTVWFVHTLVGVFALVYLLSRGEAHSLIGELENGWRGIVAFSSLDVFAWTFFALATITAPISIATAISGGYIALAAILGILVNKEKLKPHQLFGVVLAVGGIVVLSLTAS